MYKINQEKIKQWLKSVFDTSLGIIILVTAIILLVFWRTCFIYIQPNEYGIKQVNIGFNRGLQKNAYTAGLYFIKPFGLERMYLLPKSIQAFHLTNKPETITGSYDNAAHIQTSDGFFVDVDITILYRIVDPVKVVKLLGPGKGYEINGIIPKTEPILKETLGQLTTEEFYNSPLRVEKMALAKTQLQAELILKGIQIEEVLIRYFVYSDEIQRNIEEKKLQDQLVFKNQSETKAAIENAKLEKTIQEGKAAVNIRLEKGSAYQVKRDAQKDLYVRKKYAEADLLIDLAKAYKTNLKNKALRGAGSKNLVRLKMVEALSGIEMIVLPSDGANGINPLNLDTFIRQFEGPSKK